MDLVEELAKVIQGVPYLPVFERLTESAKAADQPRPDGETVYAAWALEQAQAILSRLSSLGYVIVPREPTKEMGQDGLDAMVRWIEARLGPLPELPPPDENGMVHLTEEQNTKHSMHCGMLMRNSLEIAAAYRAMIECAEKMQDTARALE